MLIGRLNEFNEIHHCDKLESRMRVACVFALVLLAVTGCGSAGEQTPSNKPASDEKPKLAQPPEHTTKDLKALFPKLTVSMTRADLHGLLGPSGGLITPGQTYEQLAILGPAEKPNRLVDDVWVESGGKHAIDVWYSTDAKGEKRLESAVLLIQGEPSGPAPGPDELEQVPPQQAQPLKKAVNEFLACMRQKKFDEALAYCDLPFCIPIEGKSQEEFKEVSLAKDKAALQASFDHYLRVFAKADLAKDSTSLLIRTPEILDQLPKTQQYSLLVDNLGKKDLFALEVWQDLKVRVVIYAKLDQGMVRLVGWKF